MGKVSTTVQNHTIETTTIPLTTNGFVLSDGWISQTTYANTSVVDLRIGTKTSGSSISFPLTSASAFCVVGSVNYNHGLFDVLVTPPSNVGPQQKGEYNGSSRWIGLDTMLYLATGFDRSQTYQIEMTNELPGLWLHVSSVVVFDTAPPMPTGTSASATSSSSSSSHPLTIGAIVRIAVAGGLVLLAIVALLYYIQ